MIDNQHFAKIINYREKKVLQSQPKYFKNLIIVNKCTKFLNPLISKLKNIIFTIIFTLLDIKTYYLPIREFKKC